jgi:O-antigen/teichoic acid export membrane protein
MMSGVADLAVDKKPEAPAAIGHVPMPKRVAKDLLHGASALGIGMVVERGFGFLANLLAARIGGASVFGAYSLALSTANNISSYAAGGIGSTAVRFSGRYSRESTDYRTLTRVLGIISVLSAALAALTLWLGAGPIAHLLGKESLTGLLHWSALSAAGIILLECCRGFLVGQRRIPAILLLSLSVGIGMIVFLPLAARVGPNAMIASQAAITLGAVCLCVLCYRLLGLASQTTGHAATPLGPMLREVWSFGLVQLAGLVGMNAAGWWLTTLIARSDTSLVQMGFLAISHQLRNIVGLAPGLLTESSLAVMARGEGKVERTPDQVMAACTLATTFIALLVASIGIIVAPWGLELLYGRSYRGAAVATALALATAVIHMGSSPAAARLSIVSIRTTGIINSIWALLVAAGASTFFFGGGNAAKGALIYLLAHLFSSVLVLGYLRMRHLTPAGMNQAFLIGVGASLSLAVLAVWRDQHAAAGSMITTIMTLIGGFALAGLVYLGRRRGWLPSARFFLQLMQRSLRLRMPLAAGASGGGVDA